MKKVLFAVCILFTVNLYAQPTLTHTIVPVIGNTIVTNSSDTAFSEGPAGANQTWNFSSFTNTGNYSADYVNPSTTAYVDSVPGSNLAANGPGATVYYNSTNGILELMGIGTAAYVVIYSDPSTLYSFPFTFNSSVNDNNAGHYVYGGGTIYDTRTGTTQVDGDAYGTVTTPLGTFPNVLRMKTVQNTTDVTSFSTSNSTVTSYTWYSPAYNNLIAQINYTVGDVGGVPYSVKSINYGAVTPSAIININNLNEGLFIANLNNESYTIQLRNGGTIQSATVTDMQGKTVIVSDNNNSTVVIDMKNFAAGIYIVRILGNDGKFYQTKLLR